MSLTQHQKRVLAALFELERRHKRQWWGRDAVGEVVRAGGYHAVIQKRTMLKLSEASLVMLEVESWPADTRRLVFCNCAAYRWGLTDAGRSMAETLSVRWPEDADKRFAWARCHDCHDDDPAEGRTTKGDRFEPRMILDDEDDDPADFWKGRP